MNIPPRLLQTPSPSTAEACLPTATHAAWVACWLAFCVALSRMIRRMWSHLSVVNLDATSPFFFLFFALANCDFMPNVPTSPAANSDRQIRLRARRVIRSNRLAGGPSASLNP
ncbi:hypothetical protein BC940DRAFT_365643 [Gongronella butleri]|nr:hypothetical protein BC940DRAFT_365643 [Gongronella butleri]